MKTHLFLLSFFLLPVFCIAQDNVSEAPDTVRQRIFLIGDGGALVAGKHPVIDWLKKNVDWDDARNTALFLGDNIYPEGLPTEGEDGYDDAKEIIDYQLSLVKGKKSKAYVVPGNHDWWNGKPGGLQRAINQTNYINSLQQENIVAEPLNGCPGPEAIQLDSQVVIVLMDSQWFLHSHDKPGPGSSCAAKTIDEFTTALNEIVATHPNQLLILAMHHPIKTEGVHGGAFALKHHIFPLAEAVPGLYIPLPVIGSIYPIARGIFGNVQDVNHPKYRTMANTIEDVLKKHSNAIVVSGHDHSLQLLRNDSIYQIVSGSAAKLTRISKSKRNNNLLFAIVQGGFAVVEVRKSGKVETRFYDLQSDDYRTPTYTKQLRTIKPIIIPIASTTIDTLLPLPDSITVIANKDLEGRTIKNLFLGKNYRQEWTTEITVPVLDLGTEMGGLKPKSQGGGKQTKSLRLEEKDGKEWVLRSIQKFPDAAIPADLRQTIARDIVEQGISASYPYAALSYSTFANAIGLPVLRKKLIWVPNDPRLDRFRDEFDSTLAVLEEREPINVTKTDNTDDLVLKLAKDNDDHVDQRMVLKARLLDNFIMDFDRHEDQWRWATRDTGKGKIYYPIPRDQDQAFFINRGIIPYFVKKRWVLPEIQGFEANTPNIKTFNRPARNFDRFFLTELSETEWQNQTDSFLTSMTDEVISTAMHKQPREVQGFAMNSIIKTLQKKREKFKKDILDYYRFISKEVNVVGSNQRELFTISKKETGVHVVVNKIDKEGNISSKIYDRLFDPAVTHHLRLYGLSDDDSFVVKGGNSPIKIRIIGGPGNDKFVNEGNGGKVLVYDASFEENKFTGNAGLKNRFSRDPQVNRYDRLNYKYDQVIPGATIAYNVDDGVYVGAKIEIIKQGFRKEDYRMRHYLKGSRAIKTSSLRFNYEGDYIKVVGNHDLLFRADIKAPINVTNFFGLGNETIFDEDKPGSEKFYRARYNTVDASVLLRRQLQSWMRIYYGVAFQSFRVEQEQNIGKFVSQTSTNGLDPATLYKGRAYAGGIFKLDVDSRDNEIIPERGFLMNFNVRPLLGLTNHSNNLVQAEIDMRLFASIFAFRKLVVATRLGYGRNFGKFEFPQAYYLGGTENLRGYRRDRFGGRSAVFNNTEIRYKVADFNTYLFPGSFGLLLFNDVGRVKMDGEKSTDWHVGNGGGIWIAPVKRFVITALATRSKEEKLLPYITFGFQF